MTSGRENPFESIESAREFITMLSEVIAEAKLEVEEHIQQDAVANATRSRDALRIAHYNLVKLESHVSSSRRIMNDLRSLRRLLFSERSSAAQPFGSIAEVPVLDPVAPPVDAVIPPRFAPTQAPASAVSRAAAAMQGHR
jgi:hypothetical protein